MSTKRRGYILIFVLGVTTVVTALGISYVSSNGTVMQQATNRYTAVRAQYLAESGAELATHFVHYPPTSVAYNGVYSGASGIAIDSTFDTVNIAVTPSTPANRYVINATSLVMNAAGTQRMASKGVTVESIIPPEPKWKIAEGLELRSSATIPSGVTISGNIHCNGVLNGLGACTGAVSATGTALWLGSGPPTSVQSLRPSITMPAASSSLYTTYKVNHTSYAAYTGYSKLEVGLPDASSLASAVNSNGLNPGRILVFEAGNIRIKANVTFTGTLVVRGNLEIDGKGFVLQAVTNYPALVVTGDILTASDGVDTAITGAVICGGSLTDNGNKNAAITINGALIANNVARSGTGSQIRVNWSAANSTFWNMQKTASPEPYTVLEWRED